MNYKLTIDKNVHKFYDELITYCLISINIKLDNGINIIWNLTDISAYPSNHWIKLLEEIKNPTGSKIGIRGGSNSNWNLYNTTDNVILLYIISGAGGDSDITIRFPIEKSIPMIEDIIRNIIKLETWLSRLTFTNLSKC